MNKVQLDAIYKVFDINTPIGQTYGSSRTLKDVYQIGETTFYFGGTSYFTAKNIPYDVAAIIHQKYPNNEYSIRVNGGREEWVPQDFVHDRFLEKYHIDSYEGVIIFLSELKDYYAEKEGLEPTAVKNYYETLSRVLDDLLRIANPQITSDEWIRSDDRLGEKYDLLNRRDLKNKSVTRLKEVLKNFEKAVNPFEVTNGTLDEPINYLNKVRVIPNSYDDIYSWIRKDNCLEMYITDKSKEDCFTKFVRDIDGFGCRLDYSYYNGEHLEVIYSYDRNSSNGYGFNVTVERYRDDHTTIVKYDFNITDKKIEYTHDGKTRTYSYKDYCAMNTLIEQIINEVTEATKLASSITLDNMMKKESVRTRIGSR